MASVNVEILGTRTIDWSLVIDVEVPNSVVKDDEKLEKWLGEWLEKNQETWEDKIKGQDPDLDVSDDSVEMSEFTVIED